MNTRRMNKLQSIAELAMLSLALTSCSNDDAAQADANPSPAKNAPWAELKAQVVRLDDSYGLEASESQQPTTFEAYMRTVVTADALGAAYGTAQGGPTGATLGSMLASAYVASRTEANTSGPLPQRRAPIDRGQALEDVMSGLLFVPEGREAAKADSIGYYHNATLLVMADEEPRLVHEAAAEMQLVSALCRLHEYFGTTGSDAEALALSLTDGLGSSLVAYGDDAPPTGFWQTNAETYALLTAFAATVAVDADGFSPQAYTADYLALVEASQLSDVDKSMMRNAVLVSYAGSKLWRSRLLK